MTIRTTRAMITIMILNKIVMPFSVIRVIKIKKVRLKPKMIIVVMTARV